MSSTLLERRTVVYCGACGMPPEYCEYGPDFETHCNPWLLKHDPHLHAKLKSLRMGTSKGAIDESIDEEIEEQGVARPTRPWTTEERLIAFYNKYLPEKVESVPGLLEKYEGKEEKLFVALVKKYGPEPEDPYFVGSSDSDEDDVEQGMEDLNLSSSKTRRGAAAKKVAKMDTRVVIQKISRNKRKAVTIVVGMDTISSDIKLKDVSKAFSKRFAGSSSVKDGAKGKEIIIQGDHMDEVASMIVDKFKVPKDSVFLDIDGEFVPFG